MKLKRTEKARRTTLAPHGLVEKDNYYIIGDKYVRVLTVSAMPKAITEGFLAQFISSPDYHIDFSTSLMNIDFASYMQKEINHLEEQINKTNTDTAREELITRYYTMQETGLASNSDEMRKLRADYTYSYFPREMHSIRYFPSLVKYLDPSRPSVSEEKGSREWVRMRLGETYLLAAEAAGRKGDFDKAAEYILSLIHI